MGSQIPNGAGHSGSPWPRPIIAFIRERVPFPCKQTLSIVSVHLGAHL